MEEKGTNYLVGTRCWRKNPPQVKASNQSKLDRSERSLARHAAADSGNVRHHPCLEGDVVAGTLFNGVMTCGHH